ncbi:hypothetical protein DFP93_101244 [Aneurinibacillus soli]|uniref:Uncharacterized protein n=1 Tax=Aneurinibacillus soli TaxID=1500254 RepID=A0A0U5BD86_9BACL|nr:hypothetical protein [Aneurinibacillus soli]PYE64218.1 hypothetical protein DFP93_101244 [Aneurinibacillus soli]BAU28167.1 hypothetical protein CB4_02341 [Aneurinibacillus soli]
MTKRQIINANSQFTVAELSGGRLSWPFFPSKIKPFVKGFCLEVPGISGVHRMTYSPPMDAELLSVAVGASRYDSKDNWSVEINGERFIESIYTKDLPEGMYLMVVKPVLTGDEMKFVFDNQSGEPKEVWFNYQFLID